MKIWLVTKLAYTDPDRKVYILGAHSSQEKAKAHQKEVEEPSLHTTHIIGVEVDNKQSPILIGVADSDITDDCQHNLPQG